MVFRATVIVLALIGLLRTAHAVHLGVYILTGQSNSLGTTELEGDDYGPGRHEGDAQTRFFWSNPSAIGSANPDKIVLLGDSSREIKTLQMQQGRGVNPTFWGPEFGFARTMFDAGHTNTIVIKVSRGGGGNGFWVPEHGHMAHHLLQQIDVALKAIKAAGHTFEVKGFMYLQGESNNVSEAKAADQRFQSLVDTIKSRVNSSSKDAAADMYSVIAEVAASTTNCARIETTQRQQELAKGSRTIGFVPTRDLPLKSDNLHFGRNSKLQIGNRFANAFLNRTKNESP